METLKRFKVTAEIDTNKDTYHKSFTDEEHGNVEEAIKAMKKWVEGNLP